MIRNLYRRIVPQRIRRAVRRIAHETPIRIVDAIPDLLDHVRADPLPPARLRAAVGIDSSRAHYVAVGRRAAAEIAAFVKRGDGDWLDFGCGSGRVARHFSGAISGVDVDRDAIAWCAKHLRGAFRVIDENPPLPFGDKSFDVIYAVSVFTHFDERAQFAWLAELRRVLRDGGVLIATLHGPELVYNRPDLSEDHHRELQTRGFTFAHGTGAFNEDSAFHSASYVAREWRRFFRTIEHRRAALFDYQDVAVCIA